MLSNVLDEVANGSKYEGEAAYENESRFNILAEMATDGKTTLPEDLSPVFGDRIQLQQVLLNLVMNSKHSDDSRFYAGSLLR
jgi:signal transduction histidine kinase